MSAKPVRTRPTPGDPGSRLTANVEPLLTTPVQQPATTPAPAASAPASPAPDTSAASTPATAPSTEPEANATPPVSEAEAAGAAEVEQPKPAAKRKAPRKTPTPPADEPKGKRGPEVQFSTRIPEEVLAQSRAVVMFTAPYGGPRSLAELVESALIRENQRLAEEFNDGEPYKAFTGKFRTGRPLGS
ncbi:hypothetical protein ACFV9C_42170 [Kribbella sp. NPDC059898]|uniref:hypothetical protein n=1 Tax=Kribbella sp. NPDC059898 TaxID=3346995 RepID=UPI00364B8EC9